VSPGTIFTIAGAGDMEEAGRVDRDGMLATLVRVRLTRSGNLLVGEDRCSRRQRTAPYDGRPRWLPNSSPPGGRRVPAAWASAV
jgi:hypothetical protein